MAFLSIHRINQNTPYTVQSTSDNLGLTFMTQSGLCYEVSFIEDYTFLEESVYQICVNEKTGNASAKDEFVRQTLIVIIEEFFRANENVLMYICDTSDGKQAVRNRLFNSWFTNYDLHVDYLLLTTQLEIDSSNYFASLIITANHPQRQDIEDAFNQFTINMNDKLL